MFDVPAEINFAGVYRVDIRLTIARKKKETKTEEKFIAGLIIRFYLPTCPVFHFPLPLFFYMFSTLVSFLLFFTLRDELTRLA